MKRWTLFMLWLIALLIFSTGIVLAQDETGGTGQDVLWQMLAPIIAIATTTERMIEIFWGRYEEKIWPNKTGITDRKSKEYIFHKQQLSQWLGTGFAIIAVGLTNARFFHLLGIEVLFAHLPLFDLGIGGILDDFTVGTLVDWFITAGVIGWGGTELVHNIIEVLIKGRGLWKETQQVRAGERQLTDTQIFYDYILPQMEKLGIKPETFYAVTGWLRKANIPLDDFISAATDNTLDAFFEQLESSPSGAKASEALHNLLEKEEISTETLVQVPNMLALLNPDVRKRLTECES